MWRQKHNQPVSWLYKSNKSTHLNSLEIIYMNVQKFTYQIRQLILYTMFIYFLEARNLGEKYVIINLYIIIYDFMKKWGKNVKDWRKIKETVEVLNSNSLWNQPQLKTYVLSDGESVYWLFAANKHSQQKHFSSQIKKYKGFFPLCSVWMNMNNSQNPKSGSDLDSWWPRLYCPWTLTNSWQMQSDSLYAFCIDTTLLT